MKDAQVCPPHPLKIRVKHSVARVSQELYRASATHSVLGRLYRTEARYFSWLCGQAWLQRRYWATEVDTIERFLQQTQMLRRNPALEPKQLVQQALLGNLLHKRWRLRVPDLHPAQVASIVTTHGQSNFVAAYQKQQGVILTCYHAFACRFVLPLVASIGGKPQLRIEPEREVANAAKLTYTPEMDALLNARQLYAAKDCLAQGGIVHILQDGSRGQQNELSLPFLQRVRRFRITFAELALLTGAVVLPVSATLHWQGHIEISFLPPFDAGQQEQAKSERIAQLVQQYVAFLEAEWVKAPGNIPLRFMGLYLRSI